MVSPGENKSITYQKPVVHILNIIIFRFAMLYSNQAYANKDELAEGVFKDTNTKLYHH